MCIKGEMKERRQGEEAVTHTHTHTPLSHNRSLTLINPDTHMVHPERYFNSDKYIYNISLVAMTTPRADVHVSAVRSHTPY